MNKWLQYILVAAFLVLIFLINILLCFNPAFFRIIYPQISQHDKFGWKWADQTYKAVSVVTLLNQGQQFDNFSLAPYQIVMSGDELTHMMDVKNHLIKTKVLAAFLVGILVAIIVKLVRAKKLNSQLVQKMIRQTLVIYVVICITISIVMIQTWSTFFLVFHRVLFPNGLWFFPDSSTLIRLFPEIFWQKIFALIVFLPIIELVVLYLLFTSSRKFFPSDKIAK